MQPENSQVPIGPEQLPMPPTTVERGAELPIVDTGIDRSAERHEQAAEASAAAADAAAFGVATPVVAPINPVVPPPSTTALPVDDTPIIAADEDVIEKEWVDKAKKIIEETKDDPHTRTQRVNDLQQDYLKKRYGKVLGASE